MCICADTAFFFVGCLSFYFVTAVMLRVGSKVFQERLRVSVA